MKCPIDGAQLTMSERQGIEIDYCPQCRGVWLDRGELDKIIDRNADFRPSHRSEPARPPQAHNDHRYDERNGHLGKKKREGFLGDLFDFGD